MPLNQRDQVAAVWTPRWTQEFLRLRRAVRRFRVTVRPCAGVRGYILGACASIEMSISSPMFGISAFMPKSERLIAVWASKPAVGVFLLNGFGAILLKVTSMVTGFVTPSRVSSPVTLPFFSPVLSTDVLLNVISRNSATL